MLKVYRQNRDDQLDIDAPAHDLTPEQVAEQNAQIWGGLPTPKKKEVVTPA